MPKEVYTAEPHYYSMGLSKMFIIVSNFTLTVTGRISVILPGDFKAVCTKQVFCFNSVHINKVPLYNITLFRVSTVICKLVKLCYM